MRAAVLWFSLLLWAAPAWAEDQAEFGPKPAPAAAAAPAEAAPKGDFERWLYGSDRKAAALPATASGAAAPEGAWLRGLLWTALLMAAGAGALVVFKRFGGRGARALGSSELAVLGRTHLSPKHAVYTVRVASQVLIIGVTSDRITALGEVTDREALARLVGQRAAADPAGAAAEFRRALASEDEQDAPAGDYLGQLSRAGSALDRIRSRLAALRA